MQGGFSGFFASFLARLALEIIFFKEILLPSTTKEQTPKIQERLLQKMNRQAV